ncbi:hypothetical protein BC936DRAFT_141241 [Jimgerdemannia flammicorona]|uniref:Uncharacterized protein n=1 Tax=Jimgerdemannia flammicorona TaxID=994334 RepID=A0A433A2L1_9FUNG|nr:hypothetical protein BC936DRAFT_141241 [Jimgerdemannia flammicorona]
MEIFLDLCVKYNVSNPFDVVGSPELKLLPGGVMDDDEQKITHNLERIQKEIAGKLPDPTRAANQLQHFAKLNDHGVYKMLRECMDSQADYKALRKAAKDALKRIDQASPIMAETFAVLMRKIALLIINKNTISHLLRRIKAGAGGAQKEDEKEATIRGVARTLLKVRLDMTCSVCLELPKFLTLALHSLMIIRTGYLDCVSSHMSKPSSRVTQIATRGE